MGLFVPLQIHLVVGGEDLEGLLVKLRHVGRNSKLVASRRHDDTHAQQDRGRGGGGGR